MEPFRELNSQEKRVLHREALALLEALEARFGETRLKLLKKRELRQEALNRGEKLKFLPRLAGIRRDSSWQVAPPPPDLELRRVEITGPTDRKMVINALNSGADVFMADFEDANTPTWNNLVEGQLNLKDAVEGNLELITPEGKEYRLKTPHATLVVRPRGWHLDEKHLTVKGQPVTGALFDFAIFVANCAATLLEKGSGPYLYLPKLESAEEAHLWSEVFHFTEEFLGLPKGSIRCTVLIETIPAAFEMEEILYELRDSITGLNAGRWDYLFSIIKRFQDQEGWVFPDRSELTMTTPFMRAYATHLVHACHKRGAHAMGGMAAFIPNRKDAEVTERALRKVREDKVLEAEEGFDGTWVAHPDLVSLAKEVFDEKFAGNRDQKKVFGQPATAAELLSFRDIEGEPTEEGLRHNLSVAIEYLTHWLKGRGAVALYNLMEDAATAEISRSQVWQWIQRKAFTEEFVRSCFEEELAKLSKRYPNDQELDQAAKLVDEILFSKTFSEFITTKAYEHVQ